MRSRIPMLTLSMFLLVTPVRAEEDAAARALVTQINEQLGRIGSSLAGIGESTSQSAVDAIREAIQSARQIRTAARELADKHPESEPARAMAENYPAYAERFIRAAEGLLELKRLHKNQASAELVRRCTEAQKKLEEESSRYLDHNDPEGEQKLPELAEKLGSPLSQELADEDRRKSDIENLRSTARDFSDSHELWSGVRDRLRDGADGTYDRLTRALEDEHRACDVPTRQKQNREVESVLQKLQTNRGTRDQLMREMDVRVQEIANQIQNLSDSKNTGEIDTANSIVNTLAEDLKKLDSAKGKESRAAEIASRWPAHLDKFRAAMAALEKLKKYQYSGDLLSAECDKDRDELLKILEDSALQSGREAKKKAIALQDKFTSALRRADEALATTKNLRDEARRFSVGEGKWQLVTQRVDEAAMKIAAYFESAHAKGHAQCEQLSLGLKSRYMTYKMQFEKSSQSMSECTQAELAVLEGQKDRACGVKRSCQNMYLTIDEINQSIDINNKCFKERHNIMMHCYDHGDNDHQKELANVAETLDCCLKRSKDITYKCPKRDQNQ